MFLGKHNIPTVLRPKLDAIFGGAASVELWVPEIMASRARELLDVSDTPADTETLYAPDENGTI